MPKGTDVVIPSRGPGRPRKDAPVEPPDPPVFTKPVTRTITGFQKKPLGNLIRNPDPGEGWNLIVDRYQESDMLTYTATTNPDGSVGKMIQVRREDVRVNDPKSREDRLPIEQAIVKKTGFQTKRLKPTLMDLVGVDNYKKFWIDGHNNGIISLTRDDGVTVEIVATEIRLAWSQQGTNLKKDKTGSEKDSFDLNFVDPHVYEAKWRTV
jgi:hypothetical protein